MSVMIFDDDVAGDLAGFDDIMGHGEDLFRTQ